MADESVARPRSATRRMKATNPSKETEPHDAGDAESAEARGEPLDAEEMNSPRDMGGRMTARRGAKQREEDPRELNEQELNQDGKAKRKRLPRSSACSKKRKQESYES
eukprot:7625715-Pyramimonas_sp.AAC.1